VLDATIMIVAIIPLADDLGARISGVTLALAAYLLALVVFTPCERASVQNARACATLPVRPADSLPGITGLRQ
jgi:hypothetical protein